MSDWNYSREESTFQLPPEGDYRIRIKSAEKALSTTGKDMLTLQFEVSGSTTIVYHNIVFMPDRPELTNRLLTQFFDAFPGIEEGNFTLQSWIGQVGGAKLKYDEYDGKQKMVVHYFLSKKRMEDLPAWVEPLKREEPLKKEASPSYNPYSENKNGFTDVASDDDFPW